MFFGGRCFIIIKYALCPSHAVGRANETKRNPEAPIREGKREHMRVAFYTLGCKVNQYETNILQQQFAAAGYDIVAFEEEADVYVINSCTVTAEGDRKTRQMVRRIKRANPAAKAVLTGCFPQAFPDVAHQLEQADVITGSKDRQGLLGAVEESLRTGQRVVRIARHEAGEGFEKMSVSQFAQRTRAFIKIEDGCDRYCTYCIVPTARGPVRSKPLAEITAEARALAQAGHLEMVLAGVNLSSYGRDTGSTLLQAIQAVDAVEGLARVRLGSLEPDLLALPHIEAMGGVAKLCPQFHLSLQSGCDATLRRMARRYDTAYYASLVQKLRSCFDNPAITTDLMVGFPGETEEEFAQTMEFVRSIGFAKAHVFPYSPRGGTAAATMEGQIDKEVKTRRSKQLSQLVQQQREAFLAAMVGRTEPVLFENADLPGGWQEGYTPNYTPVRVQEPVPLQGQIRQVCITAADGDGCRGVVV